MVFHGQYIITRLGLKTLLLYFYLNFDNSECIWITFGRIAPLNYVLIVNKIELSCYPFTRFYRTDLIGQITWDFSWFKFKSFSFQKNKLCFLLWVLVNQMRLKNDILNQSKAWSTTNTVLKLSFIERYNLASHSIVHASLYLHDFATSLLYYSKSNCEWPALLIQKLNSSLFTVYYQLTIK